MLDRHPTRTALEGAEPVPEHWPAVERPTPAEDRMVYPGEGAGLALEPSPAQPASPDRPDRPGRAPE
jgi:hypothetical protein